MEQLDLSLELTASRDTMGPRHLTGRAESVLSIRLDDAALPWLHICMQRTLHKPVGVAMAVHAVVQWRRVSGTDV